MSPLARVLSKKPSWSLHPARPPAFQEVKTSSQWGRQRTPKRASRYIHLPPRYHFLKPAPILSLVRSWRVSEEPWIRVFTSMLNWPARLELSCIKSLGGLVEPAQRPGDPWLESCSCPSAIVAAASMPLSSIQPHFRNAGTGKGRGN